VGRGVSSGRSVGSASGDGLGADACVGAGALRAVLVDRSGLGAGLGAAPGGCPTASIVDAARWLHTAGFALPVAAVALSARRTVAETASATGASRNGLKAGLAIA
jgi:hypothetical protein